MKCKTAKPKKVSYKLFDGEGLYLEVMPTAAKYWRLKYRIYGKEKRISFGVYPAVSLTEARQKRSFAKDQIKNGIDPILKRNEELQTAIHLSQKTFRDVAIKWHNKQLGNWEPRYASTVMHRLEKYAFGNLGTFPLNTIKPLLVLNTIQKIEETAPEMARRVLRYCHYIFLYGIATQQVESDPTIGLIHALKKYKKGHFASIDVDELPKFIYDLHEYRHKITRQTFLAIKLMFLTFIRTKELLKAQWSEINFENSMWTIPAERMKMKRAHLVPLSSQSVKVLRELEKLRGNTNFIFPSTCLKKETMSNGTILVALSRMGYKNRMTGHGFRALAMGILKEKLGFSHELVDRQLAHAPRSNTTKAYDRALFLPQRIEMMQRYGDYLDRVYLDTLSKSLF